MGAAALRRAGAGFSRLASPGVLWWSAVALALGGASMLLFVSINAMQMMGWLVPEITFGRDYRFYPGQPPLWMRALEALLLPSYFSGFLLTAVGLGLGVRHLSRPRPWRRAATVGTLLLASSPLVFAGMVAYSASSTYYAEPSVAVDLWHILSWPLGLVLLGVAALRVRGLGRWRFVPFVSGVVALVLIAPQVPLLLVATASAGYESELMRLLNRMVLPGLLAPVALSVGFVVLARPLLRAPRREQTLVEAENLSMARRVYEEAWVGGDLAAVDEAFSAGCEDRYGCGVGPGSVRRSIAGLRESFPDLLFRVEGQEASGETVKTRWSASGTDLGGVLWYPPTGRRASFRGEFVDRFEDGCIVEHGGWSDTAGLLEQLGLPRD